jgi:hypothetical protein
MNRIQITLLILLLSFQINAQFLNEIGVFIGGSNYSGDIGNETYIMPNSLGGSFIYKRNINNRISIRTTGSYFGLKDSDANSSNIVRQQRGFSFTNRIIEAAVGLEINYFDYDVTSSYDVFTPYIIAEFAGMYYDIASSQINGQYNYSNKISYSIPFGLGLKTKITQRLSVAIESRAHYTFVDDLDYNAPQISNLNFGNPNTNDWYFFSGASLLYSFGRPPCAVQPRY